MIIKYSKYYYIIQLDPPDFHTGLSDELIKYIKSINGKYNPNDKSWLVSKKYSNFLFELNEIINKYPKIYYFTDDDFNVSSWLAQFSSGSSNGEFAPAPHSNIPVFRTEMRSNERSNDNPYDMSPKKRLSLRT